MDKNESVGLSSEISVYINENAPVVDLDKDKTERIKNAYNEKQIEMLEKSGVFKGDWELYYAVYTFCNALNVWGKGNKEYIYKLFNLSKKFDADWFGEDPYLKSVKIKDKKIGNFFLTNAVYEKGEIFQYDEPDFYNGLCVSKLGVCAEKVSFPAIYEGNMPWMSVCPSEIFSMKEDIERAFGKVLVLGLGLGYYPFVCSLKENVTEITIVELSGEVIDIFNAEIFPYFKNKEKIKVVKADAIEYLAKVNRKDYDFCFADIWESQTDGAYYYKKIKPFEKKLPETRFAYWIEESIKYYLENI